METGTGTTRQAGDGAQTGGAATNDGQAGSGRRISMDQGQMDAISASLGPALQGDWQPPVVHAQPLAATTRCPERSATAAVAAPPTKSPVPAPARSAAETPATKYERMMRAKEATQTPTAPGAVGAPTPARRPVAPAAVPVPPPAVDSRTGLPARAGRPDPIAHRINVGQDMLAAISASINTTHVDAWRPPVIEAPPGPSVGPRPKTSNAAARLAASRKASRRVWPGAETRASLAPLVPSAKPWQGVVNEVFN